jgi:hypothetical protein
VEDKKVKTGTANILNLKRNKPITVALIILTAAILIPAAVAQPTFEASITITGNLDIKVGETTTLTATWTADKDVTRYQWYIDSVGQGENVIPEGSERRDGSRTLVFGPVDVGEYQISFRIWHHSHESEWDKTECVTVIVTDDPCEYEYETAFAYGGEEDANDFRENDFSRWGWSNGPLSEGDYEFELWAAAGQSNLDNGILVGKVEISYGDEVLTWEVIMNEPYILENEIGEIEVHVYGGSAMFPIGSSGKLMVAPGQYPYGGDTGSASGLSGEVYVIVHAVVGIPIQNS